MEPEEGSFPFCRAGTDLIKSTQSIYPLSYLFSWLSDLQLVCVCDLTQRQATFHPARSCGTQQQALCSAGLQERTSQPPHLFQHIGSTLQVDFHPGVSSA